MLTLSEWHKNNAIHGSRNQTSLTTIIYEDKFHDLNDYTVQLDFFGTAQ